MEQERLLSPAESTSLLSGSGFGTRSCGTTFKDRVARFWDWYPGAAHRFFDTIEAGRCQDLIPEVGEFMQNTLPCLGWVFGPGKDGGHSFTLTGEGLVAKQLLAEYWLSRAVEIPNWTFFGSRQPCAAENLQHIEIALGEQVSVNVAAVILKTSVDEESKAIDIVAWHSALEGVPQEHHYQILFLLLDEVLGEFGTQTWLGNIAVEPLAPRETNKRLIDLPDFIREVSNYYHWQKSSPLQTYSIYRVSEQADSRRGDTVVGSTCIPHVIFDLLENEGILPEDPYEGTGAELAYVAFDSTLLPEGRESDARGTIEDALGEALERELSGRTLGGAFGTEESYIDLLLLDGDNSRQIVKRTLQQLPWIGRTRIESFA